MNPGSRSVRTYNQHLNHRENRSALFNEARSSGGDRTLLNGSSSGSQHLDLESQNDEQLEGLTGKVKLLKEITLSIGESVKESNTILSNMADDYSKTGSYMSGTMNRLKTLSEKQIHLRAAPSGKAFIETNLNSQPFKEERAPQEDPLGTIYISIYCPFTILASKDLLATQALINPPTCLGRNNNLFPNSSALLSNLLRKHPWLHVNIFRTVRLFNLLFQPLHVN
ncbi:6733_t:CDS:2 [Ambispora gerdemannii]|uniref:6733_t:CDS:1 n=1 Tax=Ambispora gerdemannii TaxID=144530 RepID=A0A9N8V042_9GLOM|nr:6733_t:CDS:2 [Ambispora gerdemannii]